MRWCTPLGLTLAMLSGSHAVWACAPETARSLFGAHPAAEVAVVHFLDPRLEPAAVIEVLGAINRRWGDGRLVMAVVVPDSAVTAGDRDVLVLARPSGCDEAPSFHVTDRSGAVLYTAGIGTGDFHVLARVVARHLQSAGRTTYVQDVARYFDDLLDADGEMRAARTDERTTLDRERTAGRADGLYLPPGCTTCMLEKYAAEVGNFLAARPAAPVYVHAVDWGRELAERSWHRRAWVLPDDDGAVLMALRTGPAVKPAVVCFRPNGGVTVRPVDRWQE